MKSFRDSTLGSFKIWFGWGFPPVLLGAVIIAFAHSIWIGLGATTVMLLWFYEGGRTTCSRCAYYGTSKCGLPGLIAPLLTERRSAASLSLEKIQSHMHLDMIVIFFINALYLLQPWLLPLAAMWTLGAWHISFGPKRHHGLTVHLRAGQALQSSSMRKIPIISVSA